MSAKRLKLGTARSSIPTNLVRLKGHDDCRMSMAKSGHFTFGRGTLSYDGIYEIGCPECARHCESVFPNVGLCLPNNDKS